MSENVSEDRIGCSGGCGNVWVYERVTGVKAWDKRMFPRTMVMQVPQAVKLVQAAEYLDVFTHSPAANDTEDNRKISKGLCLVSEILMETAQFACFLNEVGAMEAGLHNYDAQIQLAELITAGEWP